MAFAWASSVTGLSTANANDSIDPVPRIVSNPTQTALDIDMRRSECIDSVHPTINFSLYPESLHRKATEQSGKKFKLLTATTAAEATAASGARAAKTTGWAVV